MAGRWYRQVRPHRPVRNSYALIGLETVTPPRASKPSGAQPKSLGQALIRAAKRSRNRFSLGLITIWQ
jgi:hypothetical protein